VASAAPDRVPPDWPHRAHSRSVRVGPLDWHVQVVGRGPTALLLHGTGSSAHSWAECVPRLAAHATLIVPDLPGHGFTTGARPASLTLPRIAADLEALLDALRVPPPALVVGHSAGAALALRWAIGAATPPRELLGFNPSLVPPPAAYTMLVGPLLAPIATSSVVARALAALGARTRLVGSLLDSTRSALPEAQRARYAALFRDPAHVRGALGFMAAADLPALVTDARNLSTRTTFVLGSRDAWIPEQPLRRILADAFPEATVLRWEGGHVLHEEQPALAAALIGELLARA
jgi:magnesium chelatase accessory protein